MLITNGTGSFTQAFIHYVSLKNSHLPDQEAFLTLKMSSAKLKPFSVGFKMIITNQLFRYPSSISSTFPACVIWIQINIRPTWLYFNCNCNRNCHYEHFIRVIDWITVMVYHIDYRILANMECLVFQYLKDKQVDIFCYLGKLIYRTNPVTGCEQQSVVGRYALK